MNLIDAVRILFRPIEPEVMWAEGMLVNDKHYEEIDKAWDAKKRIPSLPPPMSWDGVPVHTVCSTAADFTTSDVPIVYGYSTELTTNPLEDWVCEWCGNMWASDIKSCEKCGGPKA